MDSDKLEFNFARTDVGSYRCTVSNALDKLEKIIQFNYYGIIFFFFFDFFFVAKVFESF